MCFVDKQAKLNPRLPESLNADEGLPFCPLEGMNAREEFCDVMRPLSSSLTSSTNNTNIIYRHGVYSSSHVASNGFRVIASGSS